MVEKIKFHIVGQGNAWGTYRPTNPREANVYAPSMASLYHDPARWGDLGVVDAEFAQMIENGVKRKYPPVNISRLDAVREAWFKGSSEDMEVLLETYKDVEAKEIFIPARDGTKLRILIFMPKLKSNEGSPLAMIMHGGGFLFGTAEMEAPTCINVTRAHQCITMSVSYRLAPEAKFPVAYDDCWDILQWVTRNFKELGADLEKGFIVGGTSSGGQLAATLSLLARDNNLSPPLTGVYLNAPSVCQPEVIPNELKSLWKSRELNEGKAGLSKQTQSIFYEAVKPDFDSDLWSPLLWHSGHKDLPSTYFQVCGADIQRDDSLVYERVLRMAGIKTRMDIYPGLPHVFWYLYPAHSASSKMTSDAVKGLGWLLGNRE